MSARRVYRRTALALLLLPRLAFALIYGALRCMQLHNTWAYIKSEVRHEWRSAAIDWRKA